MSLETVTFKVFRFDPEVDQEPRYEMYEVPYYKGMVVLTALIYIKENLDGSIAYRASCRSGICGSDGVLINGRSQLACKTQVQSEVRGQEVVLEPLRNLAVLKDLVVDQTPFWQKLRAVSPWLINEETPPEQERRMVLPEKQFDEISKASDCISCQICYSECPIEAEDSGYLGPAALVKAYRFEADPRDHGSKTRQAVLESQNGIWRCHTVFACADACPKEINNTWAIQQLKKKATLRKFGLAQS